MGKHASGKSCRSSFAVLQFGLDRFEHLAGVFFVGADEGDKVPVAVEQPRDTPSRTDSSCPTRGIAIAKSPPSRTACSMRATTEVVGRPRQVERLREVGLAKQAEVAAARFLATGVDDLG